MRLEVADETAEGVGGQEAAEAGGIVAGTGVVEAGFGIVLVSGEAVGGRAGGRLQALCVLHFLAVGSEVRVIAELAGSLIRAVVIFPAASGDGARGADLIGEIIEQCSICAGGAG